MRALRACANELEDVVTDLRKGRCAVVTNPTSLLSEHCIMNSTVIYTLLFRAVMLMDHAIHGVDAELGDKLVACSFMLGELCTKLERVPFNDPYHDIGRSTLALLRSAV